MDASLTTAQEQLDQIYSELNKQKLIKKHCSTYRTTRQIVQVEKNTDNSEIYKQQHSNEYRLHQSVKNELRSLGITKLPNPDRLDRTISTLENKHANAQKEILDLQKQRKTLSIVEQNFHQLLIDSTPVKDEKSPRTEQHL